MLPPWRSQQAAPGQLQALRLLCLAAAAAGAPLLLPADAADASPQDLALLGQLQLPSLRNPFDNGAIGVLDFLVHHPFITLGAAFAVYWIVPRTIRFAVRWVVLPALAFGAIYLALSSPATTFGILKTVFGYFVAHPVVVSGGILILLALSLSPYILALGGVALVLTGGSLIPGPIRGILPAPLQQATQQLEAVQKSMKGPVQEAQRGLSGFTDQLFHKDQKVLKAAFLQSAPLLKDTATLEDFEE